MRNIIDNPEADAPRLVFADWCQENGEEDLSEFIRVQIERARLDEFDVRQSALEARERRLLARHHREWTRGLPPRAEVRFRRGFVGTIRRCGSGHFNWNAEEMLARHPLTGICFDWPGGGEDFDNDPQGNPRPPDLGRVGEGRLTGFGLAFGLNSCPRLTDVRALLGSPVLHGIRSLDLAALWRLDEEPGLEHVLFTHCRENILSLEALRVCRDCLHPRFLAALMDSPLAGKLKRLSLSGGDFDPEDIEDLVESPLWAGLEELDLSSLRGDHHIDAGALAEAVARSRLRRLNVAGLPERRSGDFLRAPARFDIWGGS